MMTEKILIVFFGTRSGEIFVPERCDFIDLANAARSVRQRQSERQLSLGTVVRIDDDIVLVIDRETENDFSVMKTKTLAHLLRRHVGKSHDKVIAFVPKFVNGVFRNSKHQSDFINHNIYIYPV